MNNVRSKYLKEKIKDLPRALFIGPIVEVLTPEDADVAIETLLKSQIVGIDTETRPNFTGGKQNKVALLQISNHEVSYLFRLKKTGLTESIITLLTSPEVLKVGLSLHDDFRALKMLRQFEPNNWIELQDFVKPFGIQDMSLQKLYANILGGQISKGQQLSNWEAEELSEAQKRYAATDAWACIMLFEEMQKMREEGFQVIYEPGEVPEPVINQAKSAEETEEKEQRRKKRVSEKPSAAKETDEEIADSVSNADAKDNPIKPEEKSRRKSKRRKPQEKKQDMPLTQESDDVLKGEASQPALSNTPPNKPKRKPKRKNNSEKKQDATTVDSQSESGEKVRKDHEVAKEVKQAKEKKVNQEKPSNNRTKGQKRPQTRKNSRPSRSIPEMAAPLDIEPAKKPSGLRGLLKNIVDKLT